MEQTTGGLSGGTIPLQLLTVRKNRDHAQVIGGIELGWQRPWCWYLKADFAICISTPSGKTKLVPLPQPCWAWSWCRSCSSTRAKKWGRRKAAILYTWKNLLPFHHVGTAVEGRKTYPQGARISTTPLYTRQEVLELPSSPCRAKYQIFPGNNI